MRKFKIFKHGNSQAYHFASNSVMALTEPFKVQGMVSEEKKSFVIFC